jgi:hypothetical protein
VTRPGRGKNEPPFGGNENKKALVRKRKQKFCVMLSEKEKMSEMCYLVKYPDWLCKPVYGIRFLQVFLLKKKTGRCNKNLRKTKTNQTTEQYHVLQASQAKNWNDIAFFANSSYILPPC